MSSINLRNAIISDLKIIAELDKKSHVDAWTLAMFQSSFDHKNLILVLEKKEIDKNFIIGFVVISNQSDEWEILNLVIDKTKRRQGLGKMLVTELIKQAAEQNVAAIFLEVRASNFQAQKLYQRCGFKEVGKRKNYYSTNEMHEKEDAVLYKLRMTNDELRQS